MDINKNDVIVAKEMGYIRATTEANTKNIDKFYTLLSGHMDKEEKERKVLDWKLNILFIGMTTLLVKDTDIAGGFFTNVLRLFVPGL